MTTKDYTINTEINVKLENDDVYFVGEACTDEYVSLKQLEDINKYFVNQPVVYRHDHPAKGDGGSVYGRVVESEIVEKENGVHSLKFKSKMKQTLKKHKDLIKLAQTQQELGKPIGYSVGFLATKCDKVDEADVYEVSVTNDPVCETCENLKIMEKEDMPSKDGKVPKVEVNTEKEVKPKVTKNKADVKELQKKFEESINFTKKLEKKNEELVEKNANLEKLIGESKNVMEKYSTRLAELEKKADQAERGPIIEKIFALERNELMKDRYMTPEIWSIEELGKQYENIKGLNKHRIQAQTAVTRTLEQSRYKLMDKDDEDNQNVTEYESKMREKVSPQLAKSMGWK